MPTSDSEKEGVSRVTIYKLDNMLPMGKLLLEAKYNEQQTGAIDSWKYAIYTKPKPNILPAWVPLIKKFVDEQKIPRNSYASLVIIFQKDDNTFALTSGYGYADIREYAIKDFGVSVACKSLNPNELNHLYQKQPTGNVYGLSRSLRGKYMPANDPVNQRSVLKALKGKVINKDLGVTLEGRISSLSISGKKDLNDVVKLLDKIIEIEKTGTLTVNIKGLNEARGELKEKLDAELLKQVNSSSFNDMLFGYDDDLVFKNCEWLKVGRDNTKFSIDDTKGIFESAFRQNIRDPANSRIIGYDDSEQEIFKKKLIDLIEGELDFKNEKYFRIDRKWYKTNPEYKKKIENDFKAIESIESTYFKSWEKKGGKFVNEDDFLNVNLDSDKILAHTKKISQIEFADIIDTRNRYLIHIKKGRGAYLRNLFAQGYVSGYLFSGDEDFKTKVKAKFDIDSNDKFTIIFGIFSGEEKDLDSIFTLFAKVDLLERHDSLRAMGFDVKYCLID